MNFRYKEKIDDSAPGDAQDFVAQAGGSRAMAGQPEAGPGDNTPQMRRKKPRQERSLNNLNREGAFTNYVDKILAFFDHPPPALTFSML